jgi:hypothetical protein
MADHPSLTRLAEVMVRTGDQWERGSGYLVAPGWVLTACHVIQGADCIGVWLGMPLELRDEARLDVDSADILRVPSADLALLPISGVDSEVEQVLFGRLDRGTATPVVAGAAGCPRFKLRPDPGRPAEEVREVHYAWGAISALSQAKTRTYEFAVAVPPSPDPEPDLHSPWEGMSGAAVWADGRLVGVVGQHHERDPPAILTVLPVEEVFAHASAHKIRRWQQALDEALPASANELAVATPPTRRTTEEGRARRVAALAPLVIETLAMAGATTIVAAMTTDTWSAAREGAAKLFRRHSPDQHADIEAQLDANVALVSRARDAERARGALIGVWQVELEEFLTCYPDAAGELGILIAQIQAMLPTAQQQWVQHNTARDHSVINAVQHGTQHNYYMDSPVSRPPAGLAPDESDS